MKQINTKKDIDVILLVISGMLECSFNCFVASPLGHGIVQWGSDYHFINELFDEAFVGGEAHINSHVCDDLGS